jgi:energy-coupling factor transport system ATP-binding protein
MDIHTPLAHFEKVSYQYPHRTDFALQEINLTVRKGELLGVIGATGAGKTTFCLALNGIVPQFYGGRFFGHLRVAGLDTVDTPIHQLARHVGMVLEDPETQLIATSVENEIAFALENLNVPAEEIRARIPRVLEMVRLENLPKRHPSELSGGQKQRLAIAAALAVQPDLLVLDEPVSQLDPQGAQDVFAVLRELNHTMGITIIISGHAAEELAESAHRLILLAKGAIVAEGTPEEIYGNVPLLEEYGVRPPQVAKTFWLVRHLLPPGASLPVRLPEGLNRLKDLPRPVHLPAIPASGATRPSAEALITVRDLHHIYPNGTHALCGVSFDMHAGEYVLIAGQNGAGKSTLVRHFVNLLQPPRGEVHFAGQDTRTLSTADAARRIGYVGQNPDLQLFNRTVEDEIAFALRHLHYPADEVRRRTDEALEALRLKDVRQRHPFSLPKGERARVVIAAVLALQPEVLIFDEPTTGQDLAGATAILDITRDLHRMGKTILVITHHLYLMPGYAERVLLMNKGRLLLDAPLREAYHNLDALERTALTPPQAVKLAQALEARWQVPLPLLTPQEVAQCWLAEAAE